jgi:OmpA-OmpF porin, OOP family
MKISLPVKFGALAIAAVLASACSGLQKNQALLDAEAYYDSVKQNEAVLRYAPQELQRAEQALNQAGMAESEDDMTSLAYVGLTRSQTALAIAQRKVAKAKLAELTKTKDAARLAARDVQIERAQADADALRLELEALQAVSTDRGMVMTLGDVLFATGKADLQPGAMSTIDRLARFLEEYPNKTVLIEGYTDSVGTESFNQGLSERRAASVRSALIAADVSPGRISTIGYGKARPIASNDTAEGRLRNRRVEIVIND